MVFTVYSRVPNRRAGTLINFTRDKFIPDALFIDI